MKLRYILFCLLGVCASFCLYTILPGNSKQEKIILIAKGSSKVDIAKALAKEQIIRLPSWYWLLSQILTIDGYIQAGEYKISAGASPFNIIMMMKSGEGVIRKVIIPEGFTTYQILELVKNDHNLAGNVTTQYKEGDFLPETYFYILGDSKQAILDKMHSAMLSTIERLWPQRAINLPLESAQQTLIFASIIEKETKFDDELPLIASVFYNRLKLGMRLQADPTTIYGITAGKYTLERPLSKKDLQTSSQFNTYIISGLPPAPIANPGIASIKATLNPAHTQYLYFVANAEGRHSFSTKLSEHNKHVQNYRKLSNK